MHIDITDADIALAIERCGSIRARNFDNPIALAFERIYGEGGKAGWAAVTMDKVHVVSRGLTGSFALSNIGQSFLRGWRDGHCEPTRSLLVATQ